MVSVICSLFAVFCAIDARSIIDLTHALDQEAPKYPIYIFGAPDIVFFNMTTLVERYIGDVWVTFRKVEYFEHLGTHIDAPALTGKGRQTLEQIPPERLIGPGVVIDVRDKAKKNPDYAVTVEDILAHEREHGTIPPKAIVHMNSGWAQKYPNSRLVFGTENVKDPNSFHYPGWSLEACEMLLQKRQINVLGVDTPSVDPAKPSSLQCHVYLQNSNVPLLEYVANLDSIPVRNTTMVLGAIKVRNGTGGPTRIFAIIDGDKDDVSDSTEKFSPLAALVFTLLFIHQL